MMVLHQRRLHVVVAFELDETTTHGFARVLVRAETDFEGLELFEVLFNLLLSGSEREVTCECVRPVVAPVEDFDGAYR